jgi:hypothetical protein
MTASNGCRDLLETGGLRFDVSRGALILSVPAPSVRRCPDCEDVHVRILDRGDAENIRTLAAGLIHLAGHVAGGKRR